MVGRGGGGAGGDELGGGGVDGAAEGFEVAGLCGCNVRFTHGGVRGEGRTLRKLSSSLACRRWERLRGEVLRPRLAIVPSQLGRVVLSGHVAVCIYCAGLRCRVLLSFTFTADIGAAEMPRFSRDQGNICTPPRTLTSPTILRPRAYQVRPISYRV